MEAFLGMTKHILNYFFNPSEAQVLEKSIIDQFNFLIKKYSKPTSLKELLNF